MQIDKQEVIKLLIQLGKHEEATRARQQLPDKVDHEQHANLLQSLGVDPQQLLSKV